MKIKIRSTFAIGATKGLDSKILEGKDLAIEVKEGTKVETLLQKLPSLEPPETYDDMMLHVFVNGQLKGFDYVLNEGDVLDLHIPVSGG